MRIFRKQTKAAVEPARGRCRASADTTSGGSLLALESRIMFDGAAAATGSTVTTEQLAQSQAEASVSADDAGSADSIPAAPTGEPQPTTGDQALFDALAAYDTSVARQEIVFLSPSVREYQRLLDGISPNVEVIVLDATRDGVEQMAEALVGRTGIDAIHIISHGAQAELTLGTGRLNLDSMNGVYANELAVIGQSLSEKADLLIYGCNFGQGDLGQQAAGRLAERTGADVAASVDETGHTDLGGDWYLEHQTDEIEAALVLSDGAMREWVGLLAENILESYEPTFGSMNDRSYEIKSDQAWGQTFINDSPGATYTAHRIGLVIYRDVGAQSQVITVSLRSSWNGPEIASGQVASTSLGTTEAWVHIDLTTAATLTDNASYYIRVDSNNANGKVYVGVHDAGLYAGGDLINDGGAPETPKDMAFRIIEDTTNVAPLIINLLGDSLAYTEGDGAVVIEQGVIATVIDVDSADFDTGNMIVSFVAGSDNTEDVLAIRNQGAGAGQIGVSGSAVTYGGTTIGTVAGGSGGSNLVITMNSNATPAAAGALISNITYENTDTDNPTTGARTVRFVLTDGDGGSSGNHDTTVTVAAVNDAPVNTVPGAQVGTEDTALAIGGLSVTDVDGNLSTVQLAVANGTVTVSLAGGATISSGANGTTTLTLAGTQAQINAALGTLSYQGLLNYTGPDTLTVTSTDGNAVTDVDTVAITVSPVIDAPVNTVPGAQGVTEDTALAIGGVSVTDVDGNLSTVQLAVTNGTVTVSLAGGATISSGANGTATLTLSGTQAQINAAVGTLIYQGTLNYTGPDTLTLTSADTGSATDLDTVTITVTAVNDAPVITSNGGGATAVVNLAENQIAVASVTNTDVDGGAPTYSIIGGADAVLFTLNPTTGALTFNAGPNFEAPVDAGANNVYDVTVQVADGNGGTDVQVFSITVTDVNETLPSITPPSPIPPSLGPQSPSPSSGGFRSAGPPSLPPILVGPQLSPLPNPGASGASVTLDNSSGGTQPSSTEAEGTSAHGGGNIPVPSVPVMRALRAYLEERVVTLIPQAVKEMAWDEQTLTKAPTQLSAAFQKTLTVLEEDLRRDTDTAESNRRLIVRVTNMAGITLTAGFITWLLQSGSLLASLTATLPAWRHFDPLPVTLVGDRERRKRKAETAAAAEHENKQFRGLGNILDKKRGRSDGGGSAT